MMNLQQYEQELKNHNWFYQFSDVHSKYMEGDKKQKELEKIAKSSKEHQELYNKYKK